MFFGGPSVWWAFLPCILNNIMDLDQVSVFDVKSIYMISNFVNLKPPNKIYNLIFIVFFYPNMI